MSTSPERRKEGSFFSFTTVHFEFIEQFFFLFFLWAQEQRERTQSSFNYCERKSVKCDEGYFRSIAAPSHRRPHIGFVVIVVKSIKSSFSFQGKEPSDQHIRQVCMRVMQGKHSSAFDPHLSSPCASFHDFNLSQDASLRNHIRSRPPPPLSHWSGRLPNTLKFFKKKGRSHSPNMK